MGGGGGGGLEQAHICRNLADNFLRHREVCIVFQVMYFYGCNPHSSWYAWLMNKMPECLKPLQAAHRLQNQSWAPTMEKAERQSAH
jgi:hypothetical protein